MTHMYNPTRISYRPTQFPSKR